MTNTEDETEPKQIDIISYDPRFLEEHVELGRRLTKSWKYFGQTSLPVMRQQYNAQDFDGETRLYAIERAGKEDEGKLVGFHTAAVIDDELARMEFPIVDPDYDHVGDLLYQEQIKRLKDKGVKTIQSRVSPFWGKTSEYATHYEYTHDRDLYYVFTHTLSELIPDDKEIDEDEIDLIPYDGGKHRKEVKRILMDWLDCSEQLAQSYIDAYEKPNAMKVHQIIENDSGDITSRVTLSSFTTDEDEVSLATIYVSEETAEKLPALVSYLVSVIDKQSIYYDRIQCYICGVPFSLINRYLKAEEVKPVISFWTKTLE